MKLFKFKYIVDYLYLLPTHYHWTISGNKETTIHINIIDKRTYKYKHFIFRDETLENDLNNFKEYVKTTNTK